MRLPRMSTGAWIFATAVTVAAIAAPVSYAAVSSTVVISNASGSTTAQVDPEQQLLTATVSPKSVVSAEASVAGGDQCQKIYKPPAGKALMVTSVEYDFGSGTSGREDFAVITDATCSTGIDFDVADTTQAHDVQRGTFPIGLPLPSAGVYSSVGTVDVHITGYLIPTGQLPAASQMPHGALRHLVKLHAAAQSH